MPTPMSNLQARWYRMRHTQLQVVTALPGMQHIMWVAMQWLFARFYLYFLVLGGGPPIGGEGRGGGRGAGL